MSLLMEALFILQHKGEGNNSNGLGDASWFNLGSVPKFLRGASPRGPELPARRLTVVSRQPDIDSAGLVVYALNQQRGLLMSGNVHTGYSLYCCYCQPCQPAR